MSENQINYYSVLLAHNISCIFPEIFSHFLLLDQVNDGTYNVIERYQSKFFDHKLYVKVLGSIGCHIQKKNYAAHCQYKPHQDCYFEST